MKANRRGFLGSLLGAATVLKAKPSPDPAAPKLLTLKPGDKIGFEYTGGYHLSACGFLVYHSCMLPLPIVRKEELAWAKEHEEALRRAKL